MLIEEFSQSYTVERLKLDRVLVLLCSGVADLQLTVLPAVLVPVSCFIIMRVIYKNDLMSNVVGMESRALTGCKRKRAICKDTRDEAWRAGREI
jgi:hypothetical protein